MVSNYGGRACDSAFATIDVLPQIVDAVGDRRTGIPDSGIRRGSGIDICKLMREERMSKSSFADSQHQARYRYP